MPRYRLPRTRAEWTAGHTPGEPAFWVIIGGDLCVFAILFIVVAVAGDRQPHLFARQQRDLHLTYGAVNTLLLLTSSLCVATAVRQMAARARHAPGLLLVALGCGAIFLVDKGLEWASLLSHHHGPNNGGLFTYFFVLTGIHALHVIVGMAVLGVLFVLSRRDHLTPGQQAFVEGGACFWHLVDLLWVILFALLYIAR